jgi:hypothetical protein
LIGAPDKNDLIIRGPTYFQQAAGRIIQRTIESHLGIAQNGHFDALGGISELVHVNEGGELGPGGQGKEQKAGQG